jgi:hypothetical protein
MDALFTVAIDEPNNCSTYLVKAEHHAEACDKVHEWTGEPVSAMTPIEVSFKKDVAFLSQR